MESLAGPWMPSLKYCSVSTAQKSPCCVNASALWNAPSTCPHVLQVPCFIRHPSAARCTWGWPDLYRTDLQGKGPGLLERPEDGDASVLARRESDGFYYRARIKKTPELGRQGKLFVEFEAPHSTGPKSSGPLQSTALEDVIQHSRALEHSLLPGDKVLAPWEPKQERYGPGTVMQGLETRDPQRASEDEEITVCFWNGKMVKVPLGVAVWTAPACWEKAVEMLHKPLDSSWPKPREHLCAIPCTPPCPLLGSTLGYTVEGHLLGSFLCLSRHLYPQSYSHCPLLPNGCLCCCSLACSTWWPLTRTLEATTGDHPDPDPNPTAQLLELDNPRDKKVAARVCVGVTSSSSSSSSYSFSSEEEDLGSDLKKALPQRIMVDSTVNTDTSLFEKPLRLTVLSQPPWKYWKRNGLESSQRKPGKKSLKKLIDT
uniref:Uncharacterized protein C11orf16 homolog isoform X1 n=1 Tax=Phascolarctos cinereus TaxID=38626 RepID=A0A6P5LIU7_PHACI|nr:uncharacterized protein C11orf16 homolog isoform X1 [Phascolarctos cinereus]XP_020857673.1 uncharacterized protein C11orf16 homolog isoform X1 [Phascolarctos cinereus]